MTTLTQLASDLEPLLRDLFSNASFGSTVTGGGGGGLTPHALYGPYHTGTLPWGQLDFTTSSLANITTRNHSDIQNSAIGDDHTQYLIQAGRGGFNYNDAVLRTREPGHINRRSDWYLASGTAILNAFDDTSSLFIPLYFDADSVNLRAIGSGIVTFQANYVNRLSMDNSHFYMYSGMSFQTDNFAASQVGPGFKIGYDGSADFRYIYTDQLHAKAFIADLEQALAGGQIITKSVTILAADFLVPFAGVAATLTVKDLPSATGMSVFVSGDYVRLREFNRSGGALSITDCWGTVSGHVDNGNKTQSWSFLRAGTTTYSTIAFVATSAQGFTFAASCTVPVTAGIGAGQVILATVSCGGTAAPSTVPAGFALLSGQLATGVTQFVYYKIATGSEPSGYTWIWTAATSISISIATYSGCGWVRYIDVTANQANASGTNLQSPGLQPTSGKPMIVQLAAIAGNVRATPAAGMTERMDTGAPGGVSSYIADQLNSTAFFVGARNATLATATTSAATTVILMPSYGGQSAAAGAAIPLTTNIQADAIVLDYGTSGNGFYEVNAIDGLNAVNSPYMQIVTWTTTPTNQTVKLRAGNLAGISDPTLNPTGYGLYTDNAYLKGDLLTGGGYVRIYQASGINLQESTGGTVTATPNQRAIQWWTDITTMASYSFAIDSAKIVGGLYSGWNITTFDANPSNGVVAEIDIRARGTNVKDALLSLTGDSSALGSLASAFLSADNITLTATNAVAIYGGLNVNGIAVGSATVGWLVAAATTSTAVGFTNVRMGIEAGTPRVIWEHYSYTEWGMDNNTGTLRFFTPGSVKMSIDASGNLAVVGTMKTASGVAFDVGGYTGGAVAQAGYVSVVIAGVTRRLLVG